MHLATELTDLGAEVRVYDPLVLPTSRRSVPSGRASRARGRAQRCARRGGLY